MSNCNEIQNTSLTPDEVLNILMYGLSFCVMSLSYILSKIVRFYGPLGTYCVCNVQ